MKHTKRFETYLYSAIGVTVMAIIVIALNIIVRPVVKRLDLTQDKLYTLSVGTRHILGKLDTPVQVRFYFSQSDPSMPVEFKTYAAHVEDMLNEFKLLSKGKLEIKKLDPVPDSEAEDSAQLDGIEGQLTQPLGGDRVYFGLAVSCLDSRATLPFLSPNRERLLEYDLTRAIAQVVKPQKPVVGVMSGLPVFGGFNPAMMQFGGGDRTEPWLFISELQADFDVKEIPMTADKIDEGIQVLLVIYPKDISEATEFALDQFVLGGGKLIAFLDPLCVMDSGRAGNPMQAAAASGASLERLLKTWGLSFDLEKVVADKEFFSTPRGPDGRPQMSLSILQLPPEGMDTNDVVTSPLVRLFLPFAGAFSGAPATGLKETVLLHTSSKSGLEEKMLAQMGGNRDFSPSGNAQALAIRLSGKFKTSFPDGKPDEKKDPADEKPDDKVAPAAKDAPLKESKEDGVVVLVGDADLLHDQFYANVRNFFGQRILEPFAQNLTFVQNLLEQMGGDQDLISIRSRPTMSRPFTRMRQLRAQAEERSANKIKELEQSESELRQKINEMLRGKQPGQEVILSEDAKREWMEVQKKRVEVSDALRQERRKLNRDIESVRTRLQWTNILVMPLVVAAAGLALAVVKRRKTAAR